MPWTRSRGAALLWTIYREALAALSGRALVSAALRRTPIPALHVRVFGIGKAACSMALGAADALRADFSGVLAADAPSPHPRQLSLMVGDHPLPSEASQRAGRALLDAAMATRPEDFALFLLSGGGSAIAALPRPPLTVADLAATTDALLRSGASIDALNAVRGHLTELGGGGLAAHCRARRGLVLMLSDIASGQISALASGPTLPADTSLADVAEVVARSGAQLPAAVRACLSREAGAVAKAPDPGAARHLRHRVLATPRTLAQEVLARAARQGMDARIAASAFDGEWALLAQMLTGRAQALLEVPDGRPLLLVASGEPRLRVPQACGSGGRMQQLALSLARDLAGRDFCALCAGSDGRDGPTDFAGAIVDGATQARACARGLDLAQHLAHFDAAPAVRALGLGIDRFASGTNLTDLALVLLWPSRLP